MKCLLIYYSFTGQARRAVEAAAAEIWRAGSQPVLCRIDFARADIRLRRPMSLGGIKRWTGAASRGDRLPIKYEPPRALEDSYDLVLVFSNTWQNNPCTPIRSLLESAEAAGVLAGRPFAVVVVCRRLWENNLAVARRLGEAAGGRFIDALAITHNGGNIGSLVQTTTYMLTSGSGLRRLFGMALPGYGLSPDSIQKVAPFTRAILGRLDAHAGRIVDLDGGHNFRELGGYRAADGRHVRPGLVFRSGTLANLTEQDQHRIAQLGIKSVCDFRANRERASRPSRWPSSAAIDLWVRDHEDSVGELLGALTQPGVTAEGVRRQMQETYRKLPYEQADAYRELFKRIAAGGLPIVFHCAAGKDRTGVAAALLLDQLGVPRETVIEDYLLSERFFERCCRMMQTEPSAARFRHMDQTAWEPLVRAERSYIEAMFEAITREHGSVDAYMSAVLDVDDKIRTAIRGNLLE